MPFNTIGGEPSPWAKFQLKETTSVQRQSQSIIRLIYVPGECHPEIQSSGHAAPVGDLQACCTLDESLSTTSPRKMAAESQQMESNTVNHRPMIRLSNLHIE